MAPPGGATLNMLEANYDAKKYTHGPPWYGDRNQQFRAWQEQGPAPIRCRDVWYIVAGV